VAGYQGFENGPVALGLTLVILAPLVPQLLLFAVVVSAHALPPQLVFFIAVSLARAPFNEPV
jgi:hypothetical protein